MAAFNLDKLCLILPAFLFLLFLFPLGGQHHLTLLFSSFNPIKANSSTTPLEAPVLDALASTSINTGNEETSINTSNEDEPKTQKVSRVESFYSFMCLLVFKPLLVGFCDHFFLRFSLHVFCE